MFGGIQHDPASWRTCLLEDRVILPALISTDKANLDELTARSMEAVGKVAR
jgi:hypothetical protein